MTTKAKTTTATKTAKTTAKATKTAAPTLAQLRATVRRYVAANHPGMKYATLVMEDADGVGGEGVELVGDYHADHPGKAAPSGRALADAKPAKSLTSPAKEKVDLKAFQARLDSLSPRDRYILRSKVPDFTETPRLTAAMAHLSRELRRVLPEFEKDAQLMVTVWPRDDDGNIRDISLRDIELPEADTGADRDTDVRRTLFASPEARGAVNSLFACAIQGAEYDFRDNTFGELQRHLAGALLMAEGMKAIAELEGIETK